jgi:programmed cell death 8 (apoptosis-inducing factor)
MNFLKASGHSARFVQKRGLVNLKSQLKCNNKVRFYSTTPADAAKKSTSDGSNVPWALCSLLIFGPLLFKLTSPPPPSKKKVEEHHATAAPVVAPVAEKEEQVVASPVKKVQKPYVLVGAGTASFAAAQAIKEKDPEANVSRTDYI